MCSEEVLAGGRSAVSGGESSVRGSRCQAEAGCGSPVGTGREFGFYSQGNGNPAGCWYSSMAWWCWADILPLFNLSPLVVSGCGHSRHHIYIQGRFCLLLLFFLMWAIFFLVFIEIVTILLLVFFFYVLVFWLPGAWDLSSPMRDRTLHPLHWKPKS